LTAIKAHAAVRRARERTLPGRCAGGRLALQGHAGLRAARVLLPWRRALRPARLVSAGPQPASAASGPRPFFNDANQAMSWPGRPRGDDPSAQREGDPILPPVGPKGETPGAQGVQ